jgi:dimethylhistidine N-methyltransferase
MSTKYTVLSNGKIEISTSFQEFGDDVLTGLSQPEKYLPCKYIYDDKGSRLFCEIMELPEYYLTRCETEVLELHKESIGNLIGSDPCNLVELGAGDGKKTKILLDQFQKMDMQIQYCPVDISESAVIDLSTALCEQFPALEINGLVSDYFEGLRRLSGQNHRKNIVLFLGSNIGNFSSEQAEIFLKNLHKALNDDDLVLIGFDLQKDIETIVRAYNDAAGITGQFNLNILERINRELGGNFDLTRFKHLSVWDTFSNAVKSFLISTCEQTVYVKKLDRSFRFSAGESLHTESSHKFSADDLSYTAKKTGFEIIRYFFDSKRYFADSLWKVRKEMVQKSG